MISMLKLLALTILVGSNTAYWGHTYLAEGNDKIYALRSLNTNSALCTFESNLLNGKEGVVELAALQMPMTESVTKGKESCHITLLDREVVVADYTSGTLTLYPLDAQGNVEGAPRLLRYEGSGPHRRQKSPHIHSSALSPDGKTLAVVDLGSDRVYLYAVKEGRVAEQRTSIAIPAGCGPRFSVYSHDGSLLYVLTELSDEVLVYRTADNALLNRYPISGENPEGGAHIALSPDGRYLYASMRVSSTSKANECKVSDGVAIFRCLKNGKLKKIHYLPTGGHPRHFAISKDGNALVVACRDDDAIELYPLNSKNGLPSGRVERYSVPRPVYVHLR
jgi:6-phosphogluconolactonase (cycloisomerase 2 family)